MTEQSAGYLAALEMAETLAKVALHHGYIKQSGDHSGDMSTRMVRQEMIGQVLAYSEKGKWFQSYADRSDWQFAEIYGPLVRLAIFELGYMPNSESWPALTRLFRCYFSTHIDKLLPSIFLAAVTHPGQIQSEAMLSQCHDVLNAIENGETALEKPSYWGFDEAVPPIKLEDDNPNDDNS